MHDLDSSACLDSKIPEELPLEPVHKIHNNVIAAKMFASTIYI